MLQQMDFRLEGKTPLLMHNGQLADPLNPHTKALKALSSVRTKTDETHAQIAEAEWRGSLYIDQDGAPCIMADQILALIIQSAKKRKGGPQAKAGVFVAADSFPLEYAGPRAVDALWKSGNFIDKRGVRVQQARVIRTRPIFRAWALDIQLHYNPEVVKPSDLTDWLETGGQIVGLGDYRPQFGQYAVV